MGPETVLVAVGFATHRAEGGAGQTGGVVVA